MERPLEIFTVLLNEIRKGTYKPDRQAYFMFKDSNASKKSKAAIESWAMNTFGESIKDMLKYTPRASVFLNAVVPMLHREVAMERAAEEEAHARRREGERRGAEAWEEMARQSQRDEANPVPGVDYRVSYDEVSEAPKAYPPLDMRRRNPTWFPE